jgi:epoxyqueuosine reductase QueG
MSKNNRRIESPAEAAGFIISSIKSFVQESPDNRMPTPDKETIFDEPLVQFADGNDPIFTEYKKIIGPVHNTPREVLANAYGINQPDLPEHVSVISWILPIAEKARESNRDQTRSPSRLWSHTRWFGEKFNEALRKHMTELLTEKGYMVTAPGIPPHIKVFTAENGMYSNWSERHIAYAAGLGTFSLSDGLITERGIAHRVGSAVTDLELSASPRTATGPYTNCLFYVNEKCGLCIERCPAKAISEKGHDKVRCREYLHELGYNPELLKNGYDLEKSVAGCGLCQTKVSCEAVNPTRKLK